MTYFGPGWPKEIVRDPAPLTEEAMMTNLIKDLQPGTRFTHLNPKDNHVYEVITVRHPVEGMPTIECWELEGPRAHMTIRMRRFFAISQVDKILSQA